jgi:hypothetical protein
MTARRSRRFTGYAEYGRRRASSYYDEPGGYAAVDREGTRPTLVDEAASLRRGILAARVEALAALADSARVFVDGIAEYEPLSEAETLGDAVRDTPDSISEAAQSARDELLTLPDRALDRFYSHYDAVPRQAVSRSSSRSIRSRAGAPRDRRRSELVGRYGHRAAVSRASRPPPAPRGERRVVRAAQAFVDRVPSSGVQLSSVVDHVVLQTGYEPDIVESVIRRRFPNNGTVVWNVDTILPTAEEPAIARMRQVLTDLGYDDVRLDVPLEGLPQEVADAETEPEKAAVVACTGDEPVILGYPVEVGAVDNPYVHEAAKTQALALEPAHPAAYVWVSDGVRDYFYDIARDAAVASLPARRETTSPRSGGGKGRSRPVEPSKMGDDTDASG